MSLRKSCCPGKKALLAERACSFLPNPLQQSGRMDADLFLNYGDTHRPGSSVPEETHRKIRKSLWLAVSVVRV